VARDPSSKVWQAGQPLLRCGPARPRQRELPRVVLSGEPDDASFGPGAGVPLQPPSSARQQQDANEQQDVDGNKNKARLAKSRSHFLITSRGGP
jgi:hypothetical protein